MRIEIVHNGDRRKAIVVLPETSADKVLAAACNKMKLKARHFRLFLHGLELRSDGQLRADSTVWLVGINDAYLGPSADACQAADDVKDRVSILDGSDVWIDPEAVDQVRRACGHMHQCGHAPLLPCKDPQSEHWNLSVQYLALDQCRRQCS